jgi:hypothetical protein
MAACDSGPSIPSTGGAAVDVEALPHPKPGLWQWTSHWGGQKRLCLSGQVLTALAARPGCPVTRQVRLASGAFVVEARCQVGGRTRTSALAHGDYASAFALDTVIDGASDHADYRYLGPCAPGQKPDDLP